MSKKDKYEIMDTGEQLNKEEYEELQKIIDEINEEAKKVVEDYSKNPSQISGSIIQIHETSPLLSEDDIEVIVDEKTGQKVINIKKKS